MLNTIAIVVGSAFALLMLRALILGAVQARRKPNYDDDLSLQLQTVKNYYSHERFLLVSDERQGFMLRQLEREVELLLTTGLPFTLHPYWRQTEEE